MLCPSVSKLLFWLRYLPGKSGSPKVSPVRFEMLNLSKVSDVLWNSILVWLDGNALPVSF